MDGFAGSLGEYGWESSLSCAGWEPCSRHTQPGPALHPAPRDGGTSTAHVPLEPAALLRAPVDSELLPPCQPSSARPSFPPSVLFSAGPFFTVVGTPSLSAAPQSWYSPPHTLTAPPFRVRTPLNQTLTPFLGTTFLPLPTYRALFQVGDTPYPRRGSLLGKGPPFPLQEGGTPPRPTKYSL